MLQSRTITEHFVKEKEEEEEEGKKNYIDFKIVKNFMFMVPCIPDLY